MSNPLNRERQAPTPNIVPARFVPTPEQFEAPVTQELRTKQSQMAQGYALSQINVLEKQLHLGLYKREPRWREYVREGRTHTYTQAQSDAILEEKIKVAKTARTIMMDHISEWAGNMTITDGGELEAALPSIWNGYIQQVQNPVEATEEVAEADEPEATEISVAKEESDLTLEDMEPINVGVPDKHSEVYDKPASQVQAPKEPSLGEILADIEGNS